MKKYSDEVKYKNDNEFDSVPNNFNLIVCLLRSVLGLTGLIFPFISYSLLEAE